MATAVCSRTRAIVTPSRYQRRQFRRSTAAILSFHESASAGPAPTAFYKAQPIIRLPSNRRCARWLSVLRRWCAFVFSMDQVGGARMRLAFQAGVVLLAVAAIAAASFSPLPAYAQ